MSFMAESWIIGFCFDTAHLYCDYVINESFTFESFFLKKTQFQIFQQNSGEPFKLYCSYISHKMLKKIFLRLVISFAFSDIV